MRGGITGVEDDAYFSSNLDSPRQGTGNRGTQYIVMPRGPDWDVF